ncbi:MAG TPA: hypothetical protein DDZ39_08780 [Flavobacteriaceae bacterium]|jgi:hypothetical protein|nr:hypothetical protein [Flavobacteriaceae bacterium]HBS11997.1 hypothetical protein [Flavobacteriaceae bacterium]
MNFSKKNHEYHKTSRSFMSKKIIYLIAITAVFFTGCNPMEDIYTELDKQENIITGEVDITLTDDDYDALDLKFGNFNSIDDAKSMIPALLKEKYPVWGDGSLAKVSFKWYNKVKTYSKNIYALSDEEHNDITGNTYGNFDRGHHVFNYLEAKYSSPEEGDFVSLRYRYYSGGETTLTNGFYFKNDKWNKVNGFTEDEYNAMGESYPNFSSHDEAAAKIPIALLDIFKFDPKEAGEIVQTMYELYKGGGVTKSYTSNFVFDGTAWSKYNNVAKETIKFGHDGTTWVPDNTIKYTLTAADYDLVGNGNYGNFDVRSGKNEETVASRVTKINTILSNNFPNDAEGQKYVVFYNIYNGAAGVWSTKVIKSGSEYILNE